MTEWAGRFAIQAQEPNRAVIEITGDPHPANGVKPRMNIVVQYVELLDFRAIIDKILANMEQMDNEP